MNEKKTIRSEYKSYKYNIHLSNKHKYQVQKLISEKRN